MDFLDYILTILVYLAAGIAASHFSNHYVLNTSANFRLSL
jgi:hypothetical protein